MKKNVSIGIVTYNNAAEIKNLLDCLEKYTKQGIYQIYICDNGSTDNTVAIIKQNFSSVIVLENKRNNGFGSAHNQIIAQTNSTYHVVVNPDILIINDAIANLVSFLEKEPSIGMAIPKVLCEDGSEQQLPKRNPKFLYLLARRLSFSFLERYRKQYEMRDCDLSGCTDIEFATGCFFIIRTSLLKKVGGFDERYFLYFEDADLTREVRKFARVVYNPTIFVYHLWQRAGAKQLKYFLIQVCSMFQYAWKWRNQR